MNKTPIAKSHAEYVKEVKYLLPKEAFAPDPIKLAYMLCYFVILILSYSLFRLTNNILVYFLLSVFIAHCLSSLGFLAHELSHRAIIKNNRYIHLVEVIAWAVNLIPATLWNRVHNHTHHTQTNTARDPDRLYLTSEKTIGTSLYTKIFYANKTSIKWNPIVAFHFIPYIFRNIVSAFYSQGSKPGLVPYKPKYSGKQKVNIAMEMAITILFQIAIFFIAGKEWMSFIFASPISYLLTSAILNTYIFTNHFLNPVGEHHDPILGTTTVEVPDIFNRLHFNFAYHTEHHLFPSMNSKFYPELSKILRAKYPDRYHYLRINDAWNKLWKNDSFISVSEGSTMKDLTQEPKPEEAPIDLVIIKKTSA